MGLWMSYFLLVMTVISSRPTSGGALSVDLRGAGSTFTSEIHQPWLTVYSFSRASHVTVDHGYNEVGSGVGKLTMLTSPGSNRASFGTSDIPLNESEKQLNPDVSAVPVVAGCVLVYSAMKDSNCLHLL